MADSDQLMVRRDALIADYERGACTAHESVLRLIGLMRRAADDDAALALCDDLPDWLALALREVLEDWVGSDYYRRSVAAGAGLDEAEIEATARERQATLKRLDTRLRQRLMGAMYVYAWWRPDRYVAAFGTGREHIEFPRYYFLTDILMQVGEECLSRDELALLQSPYEYGIDFAESPVHEQSALESTKKLHPAARYLQPVRKLKSALLADLDAWRSTLQGDVDAYVDSLAAAESFLAAQGDGPVCWSVTYDE